MRILRNWAIWQAVFAAIVVLVAASPASAFYWTLRVAPSIIMPTDQPGNPPPTPGANPIPLPPDPPPPPGGGPGDPGTAPEPTTAAAGLIGLGLIGMRRWLKKER